MILIKDYLFILVATTLAWNNQYINSEIAIIANSLFPFPPTVHPFFLLSFIFFPLLYIVQCNLIAGQKIFYIFSTILGNAHFVLKAYNNVPLVDQSTKKIRFWYRDGRRVQSG